VDKYALGWSSEWDLNPHACAIGPEFLVRITAQHKSIYHALRSTGERVNCKLSGKLSTALAADSSALPVVGDWAVVGPTFRDESNEPAAKINAILPRLTKISRLAAGRETAEQVLAANIDIVFIVTSTNTDFSINRLRRYVLLAEYGGVRPVIVLSKCDLVDEQERANIEQMLQAEFPQTQFIFSSTLTMDGIDSIKELLSPGKTAVFVGSSGVGKSTLVNRLLENEVQKTADVRSHDQRGRHTTSASCLFFIPDGGMIVDTAGIREVGVIGSDDDLAGIMPAVATLVAACRFANCTHSSEPGCAVNAALELGELDQSELDSYTKLEREMDYSRKKLDQRQASEQRKVSKKFTEQNRRGKDQ
jgi:ribosome biogenesis GTPase / thiamine phosphate phosphatase